MPDGGPRYHGLESIGHPAKISRPPDTTTVPCSRRGHERGEVGWYRGRRRAPFAL